MKTNTLIYRTLRLLPLTAWAILAAAPLPAQDKPGDSSADAAEEAPAGKGFDIPIPLGQTSTGVVVQNMDRNGNDLGVMKAREATRISDDEVELGDLRLKLLGTAEKPQEMNITIEKAVFNTKTSILRSRSRVHIHRQDFDLYGDAMEYNTLTGIGQLFGNVNMIIHNAEQVIGPTPPEGGGAGAPNEDSTTPSLAMP